ncbi:VLRF1 family aeRF1-type release factor [Stackebrandtia nassauensis]|uniref:Uncharacterized protein n=1 Tax=Stackebrandtia nassauensis (strain DSM 44728 / CIP 108903 / NRRL B-16338 / NBRC 102104 / LLR-40K-21) TaxID=446470 RepID=D3QB08_STANL|nr:VLRF1 family aeRF1-type release factor [Stackebrandtia nassauensis]ADD40825.1 hypothetical protein Snas_1115 [Stackebrandtia nassauensis DSM 44728]
MTLEYATIRRLVGLTDPLGVLSIYVTVDPAEEASRRPSWWLRIRNRMDELRASARRDGSREYERALFGTLDRIGGDLDRLGDAGTSGLGRALFAPLSGDEVYEVTLQQPLGEDLVVCDRRAHVKPLLAAGIAVAGGDSLRVVDHRFGRAVELETIEFSEPVSEWREMKGPPNTNPAHPQQPGSQRDLFEHRYLEHQRQFLAAKHHTVEQHARDQGWEFLVVAGEPQLRDALFDNLADLPGCERIRSGRTIGPATPARIADIVAPDLDEARRQRDTSLVRQAEERKKVAWGLDETLQAVQQGQAETLLMRRDGQWRASATGDGQVVPSGTLPPGTEPGELTEEPDAAERLIELAFGNGARVALLPPDASASLDEADGLAALLRWLPGVLASRRAGIPLGTEVISVERGDTRHGRALDDDMAAETDLRPGTSSRGDPESPLEDEPGGNDRDPQRGSAPAGMTIADVEGRFQLARYVDTGRFPASAEEIRTMAVAANAPDLLLTELTRLPEGEYDTVTEAWRALGHGVETPRTELGDED